VKWQGGDQLEFKANKIELLQELAGKAESLRLSVEAELLTANLVEELDSKFAKSPGKTLLKFAIHDQTTNIKLYLFSRTRRVGLSGELKAYLQKNPDIVFTIN
jgi:hypothetical protein